MYVLKLFLLLKECKTAFKDICMTFCLLTLQNLPHLLNRPPACLACQPLAWSAALHSHPLSTSSLHITINSMVKKYT